MGVGVGFHRDNRKFLKANSNSVLYEHSLTIYNYVLTIPI